MSDIKKIMIAIDFSRFSPEVLNKGLNMAQDTGAKVILINILNERDVAAMRWARQYSDKVSVEDFIESEKAERLSKMDELLKTVECGSVEVEKIIRVGFPAVELLNAIHETGVDLVVIGTKGRSNIAGMVFGSVAEKIHRRSPVSVLSVRGDEHAQLICKMKE